MGAETKSTGSGGRLAVSWETVWVADRVRSHRPDASRYFKLADSAGSAEVRLDSYGKPYCGIFFDYIAAPRRVPPMNGTLGCLCGKVRSLPRSAPY